MLVQKHISRHVIDSHERLCRVDTGLPLSNTGLRPTTKERVHLGWFDGMLFSNPNESPFIIPWEMTFQISACQMIEKDLIRSYVALSVAFDHCRAEVSSCSSPTSVGHVKSSVSSAQSFTCPFALSSSSLIFHVFYLSEYIEFQLSYSSSTCLNTLPVKHISRDAFHYSSFLPPTAGP